MSNFHEQHFPCSPYKMVFKVNNEVCAKKTRYQLLEIMDLEFYGRTMALDGMIMLSERDEFIYHELGAHIPLFCHQNPKKVLIIGGGDGGIAREVIKHHSVKECIIAEIDKDVVEASRKYLYDVESTFSDQRIKIVITDGKDYLKNNDDEYDIIIVDSSDPIGPAEKLFEEDFHVLLNRRLASEGICLLQAASPYFAEDLQEKMLNLYRSIYRYAYFFHYSNLTYGPGSWSFLYASNKYSGEVDISTEEVSRADEMKLKHYTPMLHNSTLAISKELERIKKRA